MTPKRGPALIIIGIVAFISIGGGLLAVLGTGPKVGSGDLASPPHLGLPADHAAADLRPITANEQPPSDIVAALVVPAGSTVTAHTAPDPTSLYDGSITLSVPVAPSTVRRLLHEYELAHDGWHVTETVAGSDGGKDIYATHDSRSTATPGRSACSSRTRAERSHHPGTRRRRFARPGPRRSRCGSSKRTTRTEPRTLASASIGARKYDHTNMFAG